MSYGTLQNISIRGRSHPDLSLEPMPKSVHDPFSTAWVRMMLQSRKKCAAGGEQHVGLRSRHEGNMQRLKPLLELIVGGEHSS